MSSRSNKSKLSSVVGFIIVTEFCERIAYYGFAGSLVLFFQMNMNMDNSASDIQYSYWSGVSYIMPLIGGYVADAFLGRYWTILIFCCIYVAGLSIITLGAIPNNASPMLIYPGLYLAALGCGGIKPNVSTMGAEQFDDTIPLDRIEKESFFNWFYWSVNMGACISYTVIAYVCQFGLPSLGGEHWGFFWGYLISTVAMGLGIITFTAGSRRYKINAAKGSAVADAFKIMAQGGWKYVIRKGRILLSFITRGTQDGQGQWKNMINRPKHILDHASVDFGGSYNAHEVDGVKKVTRLVPFLLAQIPFWGIYSQMSTAFQNQGCQMNLSLSGAPIPVSALNLFDTLAIVLLVPVFDRVLYPRLKSHNINFTMLRKIGVGFGCAILSMFVAAAVEYARIQYSPTTGGYLDEAARKNMTPCQNVDEYSPYAYQEYYCGERSSAPLYCHQTCNTTYIAPNTTTTMLNMSCIECANLPQMSRISILWQIPQFLVIGVAEILTSITCLEFFFSQSPHYLRSLAQALNVTSIGIGSLCLVPLVYIVNSNPNDQWIPSNIDEGHLIKFFFLLAGLMFLGLIYFCYLARDFEYLSNEDQAAGPGQGKYTTVNVKDTLDSSHSEGKEAELRMLGADGGAPDDDFVEIELNRFNNEDVAHDDLKGMDEDSHNSVLNPINS